MDNALRFHILVPKLIPPMCDSAITLLVLKNLVTVIHNLDRFLNVAQVFAHLQRIVIDYVRGVVNIFS